MGFNSSAELLESINSMFAWYQHASVCFAYLRDVDTQESGECGMDEEIRKSTWFRRGWTLQELIAPSNVRFFDKSWNFIGDKSKLAPLIESITTIPASSLIHKRPLSQFSIARRMSWAASRQTTRLEDIAYCLLGLFDVNMPLIYGEGEKAFRRLQEEIIKQSDDQTIFAWEYNKAYRDWLCKYHSSRVVLSGILAAHPAFFANSGQYVSLRHEAGAFSITNKGVHISLAVNSSSSGPTTVFLACRDKEYSNTRVGIAVSIVYSIRDGTRVAARDSAAPLSCHGIGDVDNASYQPLFLDNRNAAQRWSFQEYQEYLSEQDYQNDIT